MIAMRENVIFIYGQQTKEMRQGFIVRYQVGDEILDTFLRFKKRFFGQEALQIQSQFKKAQLVLHLMQ